MSITGSLFIASFVFMIILGVLPYNETLSQTPPAGNANQNLTSKTGLSNQTLNLTDALKDLKDISAMIVNLLLLLVPLITVPIIIDMIYAHRAAKKNIQDKNEEKNEGPKGIPGLYRALMTFGIIFIVSIVVVYLLSLVSFSVIIPNANATVQPLIDIIKNLSTILGTALASVVAFYFGARSSDRAAQKTIDAVKAGQAGSYAKPSPSDSGKPSPSDSGKPSPSDSGKPSPSDSEVAK
jgi:hypothetical protein